MKNPLVKMIFLFLIVIFVFGSCATSTAVPRNATQEQLEETNALNLEAVAKNTAVLAGFQIASAIAGFLVGLLLPQTLAY